jgi:hypothetical protein
MASLLFGNKCKYRNKKEQKQEIKQTKNEQKIMKKAIARSICRFKNSNVTPSVVLLAHHPHYQGRA